MPPFFQLPTKLYSMVNRIFQNRVMFLIKILSFSPLGVSTVIFRPDEHMLNFSVSTIHTLLSFCCMGFYFYANWVFENQFERLPELLWEKPNVEWNFKYVFEQAAYKIMSKLIEFFTVHASKSCSNHPTKQQYWKSNTSTECALPDTYQQHGLVAGSQSLLKQNKPFISAWSTFQSELQSKLVLKVFKWNDSTRQRWCMHM